jgi:hypothetical protein
MLTAFAAQVFGTSPRASTTGYDDPLSAEESEPSLLAPAVQQLARPPTPRSRQHSGSSSRQHSGFGHMVELVRMVSGGSSRANAAAVRPSSSSSMRDGDWSSGGASSPSARLPTAPGGSSRANAVQLQHEGQAAGRPPSMRDREWSSGGASSPSARLPTAPGGSSRANAVQHDGRAAARPPSIGSVGRSSSMRDSRGWSSGGASSASALHTDGTEGLSSAQMMLRTMEAEKRRHRLHRRVASSLSLVAQVRARGCSENDGRSAAGFGMAAGASQSLPLSAQTPLQRQLRRVPSSLSIVAAHALSQPSLPRQLVTPQLSIVAAHVLAQTSQQRQLRRVASTLSTSGAGASQPLPLPLSGQPPLPRQMMATPQPVRRLPRRVASSLSLLQGSGVGMGAPQPLPLGHPPLQPQLAQQVRSTASGSGAGGTPSTRALSASTSDLPLQLRGDADAAGGPVQEAR